MSAKPNPINEDMLRAFDPDQVKQIRISRKTWIRTIRQSTIRNVMKGLLTTGDVAFFARVAPRTVNKWCDNGLLKYSRIPGSQDRRILVDDYIHFCKTNDFPIHPLLIKANGIWVVEDTQFNIEPRIAGNRMLAHTKIDHVNLLGVGLGLKADAVIPEYVVIAPCIAAKVRGQLLTTIANDLHIDNVCNVYSDETTDDHLIAIQKEFPTFVHLRECEVKWDSLFTDTVA